MSDHHKQEIEMLRRMEKEAVEELLHCHGRNRKQITKDIIKKAAGRYVPPMDMIFWTTGLIADALANNPDAWEDKEKVLEALQTYFDRWFTKGMPLYYVDDVLCGAALLYLYEETGAEKYRTGADRMAEYLFELAEKEADGSGSIPYRPAQKNKHIYVDGIGMMCPFLFRYGVKFGRAQALEIAFTQIENMLQYGMDDKTGLPYHGFLYENRVKYGIIGWGRAVGWLLMGMAGALEALPDVQNQPPFLCENYSIRRNALIQALNGIAEKTALYQKENGAYAWQLQAQDGPEDSSATAMIAYAAEVLWKNMKPGHDKPIYEKLFRRAAAYLTECEREGKIGNCLGECQGFSQYPQIYGAYPWSLGTALRILPIAIEKL